MKNEYEKAWTDPIFRLGISIIIFILLCLLAFSVFAEYTNTQIVNAIYKAEGGEEAVKPFGILSVECNGYDECRQVCLNTVCNNRKRYADYGHKEYDTYLEFLASRYAPPEAHPLNKHWLKNVKFFLKKEAE